MMQLFADIISQGACANCGLILGEMIGVMVFKRGFRTLRKDGKIGQAETSIFTDPDSRWTVRFHMISHPLTDLKHNNHSHPLHTVSALNGC